MFEKNYLSPKPGQLINLKDFASDYTGEFNKKQAKNKGLVVFQV